MHVITFIIVSYLLTVWKGLRHVIEHLFRHKLVLRGLFSVIQGSIINGGVNAFKPSPKLEVIEQQHRECRK